MENIIDFSIASSEQIEKALGRQLEAMRLVHNITQAQLAKDSGVAVGTIRRLEAGQGVSLDTFIRILMAFNLQQNLKILLPETTIRPVDRVALRGKERRRARPIQSGGEDSTWEWGDRSEGKR